MALPPLVRVESGGQAVDFTDYLVCSFSPAEGECHFRKPYDKADSRLRDLMAGQTEATITMFGDPKGTTPKVRISGEAHLFIMVNTVSRPEIVIEDLNVKGDIELL